MKDRYNTASFLISSNLPFEMCFLGFVKYLLFKYKMEKEKYPGYPNRRTIKKNIVSLADSVYAVLYICMHGNMYTCMFTAYV